MLINSFKTHKTARLKSTVRNIMELPTSSHTVSPVRLVNSDDYGNIFRSRSYGSPFVSSQSPEDAGTNLRIRKAGDPVSMFDSGSLTINKSTLDPLQNHSYEDIGNVHNKPGNLPITTDEFLDQFN